MAAPALFRASNDKEESVRINPNSDPPWLRGWRLDA
jgi:hypothetical protein